MSERITDTISREQLTDSRIFSYVDVDLSRIACAKMDMDTVGHYSRPEVFQLSVNEKPYEAVVKR